MPLQKLRMATLTVNQRFEIENRMNEMNRAGLIASPMFMPGEINKVSPRPVSKCLLPSFTAREPTRDLQIDDLM